MHLLSFKDFATSDARVDLPLNGGALTSTIRLSSTSKTIASTVLCRSETTAVGRSKSAISLSIKSLYSKDQLVMNECKG